MNWDLIQGKWMELRGKAQATWGKLTHHDLDVIRGRRDELIGKLQEVYGFAKDEAEKQVRTFGSRLKLKKARRMSKRTAKRTIRTSSKASRTARKNASSKR